MRDGAAIVESLLVFPAILLLVIGIMQLAFSYSDSLHLKYAAYQISKASFLFQSKEDIVGRRLTDNDVMPSAEIVGGYSFEQDGLIHNVLDVRYMSHVIFPLNYKDSKGNPVFSPEGIRLCARGFCPMLKTEEE